MATYYLSTSLLKDYNLSRCAFKLAVLLYKSASYDTMESFKSKTTMAAEIGYSVSSVTRAVKELTDIGFIKVAPHYGSRKKNVRIGTTKRQSTNTYVICSKLSSVFKSDSSSLSLSATQLKVYNFLAMRIGNRGEFAIPKSEIKRECALAYSTIALAVKALAQQGFINVHTEKDELGQYKTNVYSLNLNANVEKEPKLKENKQIMKNESKLSPQGKALLKYLLTFKNREMITDLMPCIMMDHTGLALDEVENALTELNHYEMLYSFISEDETKYMYELLCCKKPEETISRMPPLPNGVTNAEPNIVSLAGTVFSKDLSLVAFHLLCYIYSQYNGNADIKSFSSLNFLSTKNRRMTQGRCDEALDELLKSGIILDMNSSKTHLNMNYSGLMLRYFEPSFVQSVSANQMKIYAYLCLEAGANRRLFITMRSIACDCNISLPTVANSIKALIEKHYLSSTQFKDLDSYIVGNIYTLLY